MPITLEKLLSPEAETSFEFMGETVNVTYAPLRYTGEMQDFAERLSEEETAEQEKIAELRQQAESESDEVNKALLTVEARNRERKMELRDHKALRDFLATDGDAKGGPPGLLVAWDVMSGKKPMKTDRATLDKLPDIFLSYVFASLAQENQPDPPKAPHSDEP